MCARAHACEGQRATLGVIFQGLFTIFVVVLRQQSLSLA